MWHAGSAFALSGGVVAFDLMYAFNSRPGPVIDDGLLRSAARAAGLDELDQCASCDWSVEECLCTYYSDEREPSGDLSWRSILHVRVKGAGRLTVPSVGLHAVEYRELGTPVPVQESPSRCLLIMDSEDTSWIPDGFALGGATWDSYALDPVGVQWRAVADLTTDQRIAAGALLQRFAHEGKGVDWRVRAGFKRPAPALPGMEDFLAKFGKR